MALCLRSEVPPQRFSRHSNEPSDRHQFIGYGMGLLAGYRRFPVNYRPAELQLARNSLFGLRRFCGQDGGALLWLALALHLVLTALLGRAWLNSPRHQVLPASGSFDSR